MKAKKKLTQSRKVPVARPDRNSSSTVAFGATSLVNSN